MRAGPRPNAPCTAASLDLILSENIPVKSVLARPPQQITSPLALEAPDSSFTGIDFGPNSFATGPVQRGAALYTLEGDFGFSKANSTAPGPEVGHEVKLINFSEPGDPLELKIQRFAHNVTFEQAFVKPDHLQPSHERQVRSRRLRLCRGLRRSTGLRPV